MIVNLYLFVGYLMSLLLEESKVISTRGDFRLADLAAINIC